jgi:hypothetical protein
MGFEGNIFFIGNDADDFRKKFGRPKRPPVYLEIGK